MQVGHGADGFRCGFEFDTVLGRGYFAKLARRPHVLVRFEHFDDTFSEVGVANVVEVNGSSPVGGRFLMVRVEWVLVHRFRRLPRFV